MSSFCSSAMKPSTEKMAKPARKLVQLFSRHNRKESLHNTHTHTHTDRRKGGVVRMAGGIPTAWSMFRCSDVQMLRC